MKTTSIFSILFMILLNAGNSYCQNENDLSVFLKPTKYIDCDNPLIISQAKELTKNCKSDSEKVKKIFEFVRDSYGEDTVTTFLASEILVRKGNSCYRRAVLLAALCRAVNIPSRLQYQSMLLKGFTFLGEKDDHLFTHGIVGIYLENNWYLYEPVGNNAKWNVLTENENPGKDMTVKFTPHKDCLFQSTDKVILKTLPIYFSDYEEGRYKFIMKIATGEIGIDCSRN